MDQVLKVLRTMCNRVGSPVSGHVLERARAGEWIDLQKIRVVPTDYEDPFLYWADAMCVDMVRKMALKGSGTAQAAVDKFLETERDCYSVNRRMRTIVRNGCLTTDDMAFTDFLCRWMEKIRLVLGTVPEYLEPAFSGGSTTSTRRLESTIFDKLSMTPERYQHSTELVDFMFYQTRWGDVAHERGMYPRAVAANNFFTVPKNGLTDRPACMEAVMNLSYQLAVGKVLRKRALKTLNIDLDHGAELHQLKACESSLTGEYATLDLSSASDRWARELVRYVLPFGWRILLDNLRATHTSFDGKRLYLEKFSSMGNGFTFELETILFATLAQTVMADVGISGDVHCYGDDLIVPVSAAPHVAAWLVRVGHQINVDKTFWEGPFRESCGGDFHSGEAVSTAKFERLPEEPSDWISYANNLRRVAGGRERYWALIKPVWEAVLKQLPNQIRTLRGPKHLGDTVIHDYEEHWPRNAGGYIRVYAPVATRRSLKAYSSHLLPLVLGMVKSGVLNGHVGLRQVEGHRFRWVDPLDGSSWLPNDRFKRVDPRVTALRVLVGSRVLQ